MIYDLLRPLLFNLEPEQAHHAGVAALNGALGTAAARDAARALYGVRDRRLEVERFGIRFPNPVGLAAGFDKSAESFNALGALGFGHVEVGTVTALAQPGNPRPRLFRLPEDEALLNRMGFNNPGAEAVAARLARVRAEPVLGINIGKSKAAPLADATADYLRSFDLLAPFARYVAINVSSPNTPGLRTLQDAGPLRELLRALRARERARGGAPVPLLLKIAPDLTDPQVDEAATIALEEGMSGIIATNTTILRDGLRTAVDALGAGGISGAPVRKRARAVVARIFHQTGGRIPIVGVGGILDAADAWKMILAGASLVQVWTGFIYRGPGIARDINRGLLAYLERDGVRSLDEAVGLGHR
ncbi:MAG: Dihydroorotate dehydrogenase (quinone) [uncultured Gemmatimonadetes bacterium]|uniref:Dihydroorotate dehydrogenase (quinone) n=1 Tax=uncultured Gemmatimonadota bacterium TaxID=203437 RepID=A0A6J4LE37_9BACT|nr:MAG: Dihydroorotate dehydrogenase (quinone) [uncultured Gemmatimonadota bacterium]